VDYRWWWWWSAFWRLVCHRLALRPGSAFAVVSGCELVVVVVVVVAVIGSEPVAEMAAVLALALALALAPGLAEVDVVAENVVDSGQQKEPDLSSVCALSCVPTKGNTIISLLFNSRAPRQAIHSEGHEASDLVRWWWSSCVLTGGGRPPLPHSSWS